MVNRRGRPIIHWNRYRYDESLGKWMRKKRYKHPVITLVKLDPEQAILAACQVGGLYFEYSRGGHPSPNVCWHNPATAGLNDCAYTRKGAHTAARRARGLAYENQGS